MEFKIWLEAQQDKKQQQRLGIIKYFVKLLAPNLHARMTLPISSLPNITVLTNQQLKKVFYDFEVNLQKYTKFQQEKNPPDSKFVQDIELYKKYRPEITKYFTQADPNESVTIDFSQRGDIAESNIIKPV